MKIRPVDKRNFNIQNSGHPLLHRELNWFATADDRTLGVVVIDLVDHDYFWVVLTENEQGPGFTAINLAASLPTVEAATKALHEAMKTETS